VNYKSEGWARGQLESKSPNAMTPIIDDIEVKGKLAIIRGAQTGNSSVVRETL
jgi:hypothetical protein